jgi:hypothetical protein
MVVFNISLILENSWQPTLAVHVVASDSKGGVSRVGNVYKKVQDGQSKEG